MEKVCRAKMYVSRVSSHGAQNNEGVIQEDVALEVVHGDSEENKEWSKWTPTGKLEMTITNPHLFGKFKPGQEFFVDLIPCEKESA